MVMCQVAWTAEAVVRPSALATARGNAPRFPSALNLSGLACLHTVSVWYVDFADTRIS